MTTKFRHLSSREVRTIKAIAEILIPEGGAFALGYRDVDIVSFTENFLAEVPLRVRIFFYVNLWIMEYCSWISVISPSVFSKMCFKNREAVIKKLRMNRWFVVRGIYIFISIILLVAFYSDIQVMNQINYSGYKSNENKTLQK